MASSFTPIGSENTTAIAVIELTCKLDNSSNAGNSSNITDVRAKELQVNQILMIISYVIICVIGLIGNGLVIYVVLQFSKMKTVTNMYILNLAISDVLFLISLPFLITTMMLEYWIFGNAMCKIYFVFFSINFFTSVFTLTAMSADRYLAVCHPVRSVYYRTTRIAFFVCLIIWSISFLVMLPIILYSRTVSNKKHIGKDTCTIKWPDDQPIPGEKAFTWYTFLLGFLIPVALISVFYISVILRLKSVGPRKKSKERKKSNRKVTRMVLAMISVYVICWLPYWCFQGYLTFKPKDTNVPDWQIYMFSAFTVLSFANSMINPLLYAFLSEVFRKSFMKAFNCARFLESSKSTGADYSIFPRSTTRKENGKDEKYEFTSMVNQTENTCMHTNNAFNMTPMIQKGEQNDNDIPNNETIQYVDKEIQTNRRERRSDQLEPAKNE
ncbi:somatostatin receptor type 2-like [Mya arenaria]|uniref:somatostatin receptor type 2-like n=1 Tax=Mya arenaria TaxID=6604 RepID=UPI0022E263F8|nr:somatostatin receptor type 2-like [Mya arenaria]XP_052780015.1 somatostatin receptor type 2-like [Mya arenaria]XP_052780029.1 somatostatin receptor type 2-like [Mya arenaria]